MGGFGSGRPSLSATCEDSHNIDLAWLRQRGMLQPGRYSSLTWSRGGEQAGSIALAAERDGVRLLYQTKDCDGSPIDVDELVPFTMSLHKVNQRSLPIYFVGISMRRSTNLRAKT